MGILPTIRVKAETESGFMIINKDDFNPEAHEAFEEKAKAEAEAKDKDEEGSGQDQLEEIMAAPLDKLGIRDLKVRAKQLGMAGYSNKNQADLIMAIIEFEEKAKTEGEGKDE